MGVAPPKKVPQGQALASQSTTTQPRKEVVQNNPIEKDILKVAPPKDKELPKEVVPNKRELQRE